MRYEARCELWLYAGKAAWHFLTLPAELTAGLKAMAPGASPCGSVRVRASIGKASWSTSLFPDSSSGAFLLPVKADVRRREKLSAGDTVDVAVELVL